MGAGRGVSQREKAGQHMRQAKKQALSGSSPQGLGSGGTNGTTSGAGGTPAGSLRRAAGSTSNGKSSGSSSGFGGSASGGTIPTYKSRKPRRRRSSARTDTVKQNPLEKLETLKQDEAISAKELFEIDADRGKEHRQEIIEVMAAGEKRKISNFWGVAGGPPMGRFIAAGFGHVDGLRELDDDWFITLFDDHNWSAANSDTNEIACSCGKLPCKHRVTALMNAHLNTKNSFIKASEANNKNATINNLSVYAASNHMNYEGFKIKMPVTPKPKKLDDEESLKKLMNAKESLKRYFVQRDDEIILDSSKGEAVLTAYIEGVKRRIKNYEESLGEEELVF